MMTISPSRVRMTNGSIEIAATDIRLPIHETYHMTGNMQIALQDNDAQVISVKVWIRI